MSILDQSKFSMLVKDLNKKYLEDILEIINFVFTSIFLLEAILRIIALGFIRYIREK